jgi:hypothetical protein
VLSDQPPNNDENNGGDENTPKVEEEIEFPEGWKPIHYE